MNVWKKLRHLLDSRVSRPDKKSPDENGIPSSFKPGISVMERLEITPADPLPGKVPSPGSPSLKSTPKEKNNIKPLEPFFSALLVRGVKTWNQWREVNKGAIDLSNTDFSGMSLAGIDLSGCELKNSDFSQADLQGALFYSANLSEACLEGADLRGAAFHDAWLIRAAASCADFRESKLYRVSCSGANFSRSNFAATKLENLNLGHVIFDDANLSDTDLTGANLRHSILRSSNLSNSVLRYADLRDADLTSAILTGCNLFRTATVGWELADAECTHIFFDDERHPKERDYQPGEFVRIFRSLPTIEFVFEQMGSSLLLT
ncbi:MAG: pentapeptide repeat-containing protein [Candidatus Scalindua sp.]